ncbi:MAG TPA: biotin carboxylase N-terminal domain-containing protein [Herbaspirillum sp.]|nr:biotin carboxylase N-terminal domain-containing protein [Herbaspirillum sp.]
MFSKILIANRGEIACRVAATARRMGIQTVAVYSVADAGAKHVAACDEAIAIGGAAAAESYLCGDKIIAAALRSGAQAVHPGYGFLSENADFAQACSDAGLIFIGPPAAAMQAMGSKSAAKTLMARAGVPLVPGYHGDDQDPALLQSAADDIGYPVLLKASAGGGGKGMRIVERAADFAAALLSCQREARASFGDDKVLIEKYLLRARHIEIQLFADTQGNCVYLFERDCSVQRRHQKVLEEAPAPGLSAERRAAMGAAAVAAAKAVAYVGAGTVEFIVDCSADTEADGGAFYFMEMNTRLQVEHPVTEMITGLDLVEWQLRVADGEALPLQQQQLTMRGHAIEARIYAENPEKGFLPAIGTLHYLQTPAAVHFQVHPERQSELPALQTPAAVRIDSGFGEGDAISPFYDPMIAKLIVWGADRDAALANMTAALHAYRVVGLASNIGFLQRLVTCAAFADADLDTGLIERNRDVLFPPPASAPLAVLALAAMAIIEDERQAGNDDHHNNDSDPWAARDGWRMHDRLQRTMEWTGDADETQIHRLTVTYLNDAWSCRFADADQAHSLRLLEHKNYDLRILLGDQVIDGSVVPDGGLNNGLQVFSDAGRFSLRYNDPINDALQHAATGEVVAGRLTAPMPGKIVALLVAQGDTVEKGAPLLVMEAMKMEHTIGAPRAGKIDQLHYAVGDQVNEGAPLLSLTAV